MMLVVNRHGLQLNTPSLLLQRDNMSVIICPTYPPPRCSILSYTPPHSSFPSPLHPQPFSFSTFLPPPSISAVCSISIPCMLVQCMSWAGFKTRFGSLLKVHSSNQGDRNILELGRILKVYSSNQGNRNKLELGRILKVCSSNQEDRNILELGRIIKVLI